MTFRRCGWDIDPRSFAGRANQIAKPSLGKNCPFKSRITRKKTANKSATGEILVIDGDEGARALMGRILAEQGFVGVTTVGDESTALRRIETKPFALLLAEIRLPGPLDGMTTIRQARARQPGLKCPFTSGFAPALLWNNVELEDFIAKPFDRRNLVGCVFELLQRDAAVGDVVAADLKH